MRFNYTHEVIRYQGVREKGAVIEVDGKVIRLGLASTWRCVENEKITAVVLQALCEAHAVRLSAHELAGEAVRLTQQCRTVTKHDPTAPTRKQGGASQALRSLSWQV